MRPKGTAAQLEARRRRAVELLEQGWGVQEVADRMGVSRRAVGKWKSPGGIPAKPKPRPARKLTAAQLDQLRQWLVDGPVACGFPTQLWTCPRVARLILDRLGVTYHVDHLSRLLRDLGFTPQRPLCRGHVILVLDNLPGHRYGPLPALAQRCGRLHLEYLPPYAPELNPCEWIFAHEKRPLANHGLPDLDCLYDHADEHLHRLYPNQRLLRSFIDATPLRLKWPT